MDFSVFIPSRKTGINFFSLDINVISRVFCSDKMVKTLEMTAALFLKWIEASNLLEMMMFPISLG